MMQKRNPKLTIAIILAALVVFIYLAFKPSGKKEEQKPVIAESRAVAQDQNGIGALGRIEPRSRVLTVSHDAGPEGARIGSLLVTEGQHVAIGEILAYFSNHSRKEAELNSAKSNLDALKAKLQASQAEAETSEREFERNRKLLNKKVIAESRKDEAELRFRQAKANVNALKAEIEASKSGLVLAEEQLKQTILTAPITGTILKIHSHAGERVGDKGVVEMADLTQMDVVAEVYERDISKLKVGQQAVIKVPGMEDSISGEVRELGFQVRKNDINDTDPLADRDNRTVEVRISIAGENAELLKHLIYMQVNVRINL